MKLHFEVVFAPLRAPKRRAPSNQLRADHLFILRKEASVGGLTISLNKLVPYTNNAKPSTCSHLKLSQPKPRLTSQINSVRQVSIVDRAVAEIERVTDRPKKLKPL